MLFARKTNLPTNLNYIKMVEGIVDKRVEKPFAFLNTNKKHIFISPVLVNQHQIQGGEKLKSLIVYDYNRKKETWGWTCVKFFE